jgi:hypothetical protein
MPYLIFMRQKLPALILVSFLIYSPLVITGAAQRPATTLQPGTPIERQLGPNQIHEFTVNLEENGFVHLEVEQRGIDLIVKVSTPAGKSLGEYDSPNGDEGPEDVSFVASVPGNYRIVIRPLNSANATEGSYRIKILDLRRATEQELKASSNLGVVKAKGIALLTDIEALIPQIKSPYSRIKAQLQAAQILFDIDEKRAAKFLADAVTGLKEYLATVEPDDNFSQQYSTMWQLRHELIQVLTTRDPDAALNFFYSTTGIINPNQPEHLAQESAIETSIADHIAGKYPHRALQIARGVLKKRYSSNLMNTVSHLRRENPEMAAELANEIAAKLLHENLLRNQEAASLAMNLLRLAQAPGRKAEITNAPATPMPALLADDKYRELFQKVLSEALSYTQLKNQPHMPQRDAAWTMLTTFRSMGPQVDTMIPGGITAVERKIAEITASGGPHFNGYPEFKNPIDNNSVEGALEAIGKGSPEHREQLYAQLAGREANNGDLARARQIVNEHVSNPHQRRQALMNIDAQAIHQALQKGNIQEAFAIVNRFRNPRERAVQLAQIVSYIGPGQKRATTLNLLEQARSMLNPSPQAQDLDQMNVLFEIARAFSRYDLKRSFEIIDPLIDQFNELCTAARTLQGFGPEYYEDEELDLTNGNAVANIGSQMATMFGSLAMIDFDRTKAASDRIRLPEVRLRAYLGIAQQTIEQNRER